MNDEPSHLRTAVQNLLSQYDGRVYSFLLRMLGTPERAEQTLEIFYSRAAANFASCPARTEKSWVFAQAAEALAESEQRTGSSEELPSSLFVEVERSSDDVFESVVERLPFEYRQIFLLHDGEGLECAEIAPMLRLLEREVREQLHRARLMVRRVYHRLSPEMKPRLPQKTRRRTEALLS